MTEDEIAIGAAYWREDYSARVGALDYDVATRAFQGAPLLHGWIRGARRSLLMSTNELARRADIDTSSLARMERAEDSGRIRLVTLRRMADAMDCDLVYAFRPRERCTFSERIWRIVKQYALRKMSWRRCDPHRRGMAFGYCAISFNANPDMRQRFKWTRRTPLYAERRSMRKEDRLPLDYEPPKDVPRDHVPRGIGVIGRHYCHGKNTGK